jgi:hypothetical protein
VATARSHRYRPSCGMRRRTELEVTDFLRRALEQEARRHGLSISKLLARAALYYLLERKSDRLAVRVPPTYRDVPSGTKDSVLLVTIELRASEWNEFERAAASDGISVERLLQHAALLFLADLESGHVAARLLGSATDAD